MRHIRDFSVILPYEIIRYIQRIRVACQNYLAVRQDYA